MVSIMPDPKQAHFQKLIADFPESPMGHFSLGKLHLEEGRAQEAVKALTEAVRLAPDYAAALLALGTACAKAGDVERARETFVRAREVALKQNHPSMADEAEQELEAL
jgi:Flp pilus assembly protein TadD